jgi:acetyl-CoA carboxylase carboxyl transferase subunit beta
MTGEGTGRMAEGPEPKGKNDGSPPPPGTWVKCPGCDEILYRRELEQTEWVCHSCNHHFGISRDGISVEEYLGLLLDPGSFFELFGGITSVDPLGFKDSTRYKDRLAKATATGRREAVVTGRGTLDGLPLHIAVMDFGFLGGSMASAVGEKITRTAQEALRAETPLVIVSASGGARMQEGIFSLMQMAKTSALLNRIAEAQLPYVSILTHPTTGGVTASFASLGDVILAEPGALIGFAGQRVIEQTIKQKLPEGFQRSEFVLEHGMIDRIVPRRDMRGVLSTLLRQFMDARAVRGTA